MTGMAGAAGVFPGIPAAVAPACRAQLSNAGGYH